MNQLTLLFLLTLLVACQPRSLHQQPNNSIASYSQIKTVYGQSHQSRNINYSVKTRHHGLATNKASLVRGSHHSNTDRYRIHGKKYKIMATANGYRARGLASWYGRQLRSQKTSSGERYDPYALSAAHRTLPLSTYVRVINLNNGKVAVVRINDRGPFHGNRIIDLSYGAATKLGMLPKGMAYVQIEALNIKSSNSQSKLRYYIQAGSFASKALAISLKSKLTKMTRSPIFIEKYKHYFVVLIGPFVNKKTADGFKIVLSNHGYRGALAVLK
ncbi:MAG: septal ring lytic transglycosylase RlpA family protein [Legionella sp.]